MIAYILKRLLLIIPTLLLVAITVFVIMRLVPGDPVQMIMGDIDNPALIEQLREEMGLNEPVIVQYVGWLARTVKLDLGHSIVTGEPVFDAMIDSFGVTAQIVVVSVLLASLLAVLGGALAAWRQNSLLDFSIVTIAIISMSIPGFWLGIALIIVFGIQLQWLPTVGYVSPFHDFSEGIQFLLLPVAALIVTEFGGILRMVRAATIDVLRLDYIAHARAKGLSELTVLFRHALRNAMIPTMTLIGVVMGSLLGGAAVIETVFTIPGLGRLLITSIYARDYVMVQGIMLLVATTYVLINLLIDVLYPLLDPRVRLER
jgi:peptide/nickel transport system permease protein